LVLLASDGLSDNLFCKEVLEAVLPFWADADIKGTKHSAQAHLQKMVTMLIKKARKVAVMETGDTPFSTAARKAGFKYAGGKLDDITVVAALVVASAERQQQ